MNNAFFSPAFRRFRTITYLSPTKTINPFIPETSLPARDKSQSNSWRNKRKEKKESSMSFPRVNFWNSLTHLLSSASAWQGSIEWIFKIILNEITKFPRLLFFNRSILATQFTESLSLTPSFIIALFLPTLHSKLRGIDRFAGMLFIPRPFSFRFD